MKTMTLDEVQNEELELLCQFHNFCSMNGLRYSLAYGTLLGAIRHKGFIPWDDDIDVLMPREDYERFLASPLVSKSAFTIVPGTGEPWLFAKVCSSRTSWNESYTRHSDRLGVFIDVFPWDAVGSRDDARKVFDSVQKRCKLYSYGYSCDFCDSRYRGAKCAVQRLTGVVSRFKKPAAHRHDIERTIFLAKDDIGYVNFYSPYCLEKEYVLQGDCLHTCEVEFEGRPFSCIGDPEKHLLRVYGPDWGTPIKHDEHLHGEAFWRDAR